MKKVRSFWIEDFDCIKAVSAAIFNLVERLSIEIFSTNKTQS